MPTEVAGSTWGSVCMPGACPQRQRWQWVWLRRHKTSSNCHITASLLKRPFTSAANATSERSVSQREYRKRYETLGLRNARLHLSTAMTQRNHVYKLVDRKVFTRSIMLHCLGDCLSLPIVTQMVMSGLFVVTIHSL